MKRESHTLGSAESFLTPARSVTASDAQLQSLKLEQEPWENKEDDQFSLEDYL
jgi:hypothetical protein